MAISAVVMSPMRRVVRVLRLGDDAAGPRYTASVDAVLALISEKLPEWDWSLYYVDGRCLADLSAPSSPIGYSEEAATPALALLSAFCLAMAAKAGEREPA